jgi:hypothetical protein
LRAIAELERTRLRPGEIAEALDGWSRFVRDPAGARDEVESGDCDPIVQREALCTALRALPTSAAGELRALLQPLDERYLARATAGPETSHVRDLITDTAGRAHFGRAAGTFTFEAELVYLGWLRVRVDDGCGEKVMYASYLTCALDDLLAALVALTAGERHARLSWEGEPTEYRWVITVDPYSYAHVHILRFRSRFQREPDAFGRLLVEADLPLRSLVRSVAGSARAMLTDLGEAGYTRKWHLGPFPTEQLLTLERWLRG